MPARPDESPTFAPRYPTLLALLILSIWIVLLCLPMFRGQFLGGPASDQTWTGIPFRSFWAYSMHQYGHIPLWNPYMFGGLPFVGAMHGDMFYPTSFLRLAFSAATTLNITFALHLILAGVLTYLFLRVLELSWTAAVAGGLAYQLSGIVASLVSPGHDGKLVVSSLLPLLLTGLVLGIRKRRLEGYALVALTVGLDLLSPHVQTTQYSLIMAGFFTLWLCFVDDERPGEPRQRYTALGLAAAAVVVGFGVSMIQMLPFIAYGPFSARVAGNQGWTYATSYAMPPENIVDWLVPTFTGVLGNYWGSNFFKLHSEYVGAATIALAVVGLANSRRRKLIWFLAGAFVLFVLVCLGGHTPFYRLWYALVPGVKVTRAPGMAFFIPTFIAACWAAFGVERIERGEGKRLLIGALIGAGFLLLFGASGGLGALAENLAGERFAQAQANAGPIAIGSALSALAAAAAAVIGLLTVAGRLRPGLTAALLLLVIGGDEVLNARHFFQWSPPMAQLYADDAITRHLEQTPMPYRMLDMPDRNGVYPTAFLMAKRIPNALGHHGNEMNAYDQLLGGKNEWTNLLNSTRLFNLLALRYVLLPVRVPLPGYHMVASTDSATGAAPGTQATLYEADSIPPYARVVPAAIKVADDRIVPTLMDQRLNYSRLVLLPEDAPVTTPPLDSMPHPMASLAAVTAWEPGRMTIRLDPAPEHDAFLLVSENWYPDWHAEVDGRPVPTLRGQHTFLTVPLAAGARDVRLWYASADYGRGKAITFASLGLIALWLAIPLVRRRRGG